MWKFYKILFKCVNEIFTKKKKNWLHGDWNFLPIRLTRQLFSCAKRGHSLFTPVINIFLIQKLLSVPISFSVRVFWICYKKIHQRKIEKDEKNAQALKRLNKYIFVLCARDNCTYSSSIAHLWPVASRITRNSLRLSRKTAGTLATGYIMHCASLAMSTFYSTLRSFV